MKRQQQPKLHALLIPVRPSERFVLQHYSTTRGVTAAEMLAEGLANGTPSFEEVELDPASAAWVNIELPAGVFAAVGKAAAAGGRSVEECTRSVLVDYLIDHGHLALLVEKEAEPASITEFPASHAQALKAARQPLTGANREQIHRALRESTVRVEIPERDLAALASLKGGSVEEMVDHLLSIPRGDAAFLTWWNRGNAGPSLKRLVREASAAGPTRRIEVNFFIRPYKALLRAARITGATPADWVLGLVRARIIALSRNAKPDTDQAS